MIVTRTPPVLIFLISRLPPCNSIIFLETGKPKPVPMPVPSASAASIDKSKTGAGSEQKPAAESKATGR